MNHLCVGSCIMADTPTPRSYHIPPIAVEGGRVVDPYGEELRGITLLLLDLKTQVKQLRSEIEELKVEEERSTNQATIPPPSFKTQITKKRAIIAALVALLTALPEIIDQIQSALGTIK